MVWENLYYVAKLLKEKGVCANDDECWNFMCIGSDFDGMVNPPDIFWTAAEFNDLREGLIFHADYYESQGLLFGTPPTSGSLAGLIIDKIMHDNAYNFIQSNLPNWFDLNFKPDINRVGHVREGYNQGLLLLTLLFMYRVSAGQQ